MPVSLDFDTSPRYSEAADGINVPITLSIGRQMVELLAKLDTGAAHCIFERKYAEILGLEVDSGRLQRFRTVTGSVGRSGWLDRLRAGIVDYDRMLFLGPYQS